MYNSITAVLDYTSDIEIISYRIYTCIVFKLKLKGKRFLLDLFTMNVKYHNRWDSNRRRFVAFGLSVLARLVPLPIPAETQNTDGYDYADGRRDDTYH